MKDSELKTFLGMKDAEGYINKLKDECTPKKSIEYDRTKRCTAKADKTVLDDWDDPCEGHECQLTIAHGGDHMASDGANGWVYFGDNQTLKPIYHPSIKGVEGKIIIVSNPESNNWIERFLGL